MNLRIRSASDRFVTREIPLSARGRMQYVGRVYPDLVAACIGVLMLMCVFVALRVSAATAGSRTAPTLAIVDRTGKSDRLPLLYTGNRSLETYDTRVPGFTQELIDGCESVVSALSHSPLSQIAGRCVS
jgi:hypothetical protein